MGGDGWYRSAVADSDHDSTSNEPSQPPPSAVTRVAFALTLGLLALLLGVAAGTDEPAVASRTGRRVQLVELIREEQRRTAELAASVEELSAQVAQFEGFEARGARRVSNVQQRIDRVVAAAGLTAVRGPGLEVVLTDSRLDAAPTGNLNDLVIHEQDLQAVINGLWAGGAEAASVNGQRILSTTAIRCVGNTLLLHGRVYSPPYVIRAVGDPVALRTALDRDPAVNRFAAAAREFKLGYSVADDTLEIPAFDGATALTVARIAEGSDT